LRKVNDEKKRTATKKPKKKSWQKKGKGCQKLVGWKAKANQREQQKIVEAEGQGHPFRERKGGGTGS